MQKKTIVSFSKYNNYYIQYMIQYNTVHKKSLMGLVKNWISGCFA